MSNDVDLPDMAISTKPKTDDATRTRRLPPYNVIIENDDLHSFEFVMEVLCKVLHCQVKRAYQLTLQAHTSGRAVIWTGTKEGAELKVEQVRSFHEIREADEAQLGPLGCVLEPAPGG